MNRIDLQEQALDDQRTVLLAMQAAAEPIWLHLDVTMMQLKAMVLLARSGTISIGELGRALQIGRPAATMLVDRLVDMALVSRAEDTVDRRRTNASLTRDGEELVSQLRQGGRERFRSWLSRLNDDDLVSLARGLRALAKAADQAIEPAN